MATSAPVQETEKASGQKPVATFRSRGVSAAVFANKAQDSGRTFHKVTFDRTYKDGTEFKRTESLGRDDLPHLQRVADQAWNYILEAESARGKEDDGE
jgi:hypothetical protein